MIVTCPKCNCKYNIPDNKIGNSPKRFRCRKCTEIFIINPPAAAKSITPDMPSDEDSMEQRAARFARVLASDIFIYNREVVEEARNDGNLEEVMHQEIQKSWDLWKSRFPEVSANKPDIFSNALDQYLADGEKIFRSQDYI